MGLSHRREGDTARSGRGGAGARRLLSENHRQVARANVFLLVENYFYGQGANAEGDRRWRRSQKNGGAECQYDRLCRQEPGGQQCENCPEHPLGHPMFNPAMRRVRLGQLFSSGLEAHVYFPMFTVLLLVLIWTAVVHSMLAERDAAVGATMISSVELTETYQAQMLRNLGVIDQSLRVLKFAYERDREHFSLARLDEKGLLPAARVFTIMMVDREGQVIASNHGRKGASTP